MSYSKKIIMYTVFQKVMTFLWAGSSLPGIHIEITLGIAEEFFDYNSPNLNGFGRNLEYKCKCGNTVRTRVFLRGNRPRGFTKRRQNVFCFFLPPIQRGLSDTYSATDMELGHIL